MNRFHYLLLNFTLVFTLGFLLSIFLESGIRLLESSSPIDALFCLCMAGVFAWLLYNHWLISFEEVRR